MSLFHKRKEAPPPAFPPEDFEPVLRCSICTGEQVACMRERRSGKLREIRLIRTPADLERFCAEYGVSADKIRKIY